MHLFSVNLEELVLKYQICSVGGNNRGFITFKINFSCLCQILLSRDLTELEKCNHAKSTFSCIRERCFIHSLSFEMVMYFLHDEIIIQEI